MRIRILGFDDQKLQEQEMLPHRGLHEGRLRHSIRRQHFKEKI